LGSLILCADIDPLKSTDQKEKDNLMRTTVITLRFAMDAILIALCAALLILAMTQTVHSSFTSVGWHELASIGWNG
jgi:hypothetical protein